MVLPGAWCSPALSPTLHSSEQAEPQQEYSLIFALITDPEFLCCFNSEQTLQQEEGVGRGLGSLMHLLGGLLPTAAETMEVFVGLQQRNRLVGKGQGRHWSNLAKWWVCCCDLLLHSFLTVIQGNCQLVRGRVLKWFIGFCGLKTT